MKTRLVIAALPLLLAAGSVPAQTQNGTGNRADQLFGAASPLPYHAPQFDKIKDSDFQPGIEAGMTRQLAEIAAITADKSPATFANRAAAVSKATAAMGELSPPCPGTAYTSVPCGPATLSAPTSSRSRERVA